MDLLEPKSGRVLKPAIMNRDLLAELSNQLSADRHCAQDTRRPFDSFSREEKLRKLYQVLIPDAYTFLEQCRVFPDPDPNYEITMDCALKMLAIEMRLRCDIPVVVMGETGCGKTKLIEFYSAIKRLKVQALHPRLRINNFLILRVHGGTDAQRIQLEIRKAEKLSRHNFKEHRLQTLLFLDEANTTAALELVAEAVLERTLLGDPIQAPHLRFALALNPCRKHSKEAIQKLENAGLGYHVQDLELGLQHRFDDGAVPLRQLVYRVNPLPPSLVPLVWDFGFLSSDTEDLYIRQMIGRFVRQLSEDESELVIGEAESRVVAEVLCAAQHFMKELKSESSFVSLRNIERTLRCLRWFLEKDDLFFGEVEGRVAEVGELSRALVLSLSVCYRSSLSEKRREFDECVGQKFVAPVALAGGWRTIPWVVEWVSRLFLNDAKRVDVRVAPNEALRENVFLMSVTSQLGIPLFLVGKPGSSKSLGRTIVAESMKGETREDGGVYQELKEIQMVTYQCSPLSTAEGVAGVFRQCAARQEQASSSLAKLAVLPVFEEIGMAEDSPRMPLKALHGLLEEGCAGLDGEEVKPWHRTGFIGISNWALDPAKMNRGIFLSRSLPGRDQLIQTAQHICGKDSNSSTYRKISTFIQPLTEAYLEVYKRQDRDYEFYGLRDFYSLAGPTLNGFLAVYMRSRHLGTRF